MYGMHSSHHFINYVVLIFFLNVLVECMLMTTTCSFSLTLESDVDQDTFGKVTKHNTHDSQEVSHFPAGDHKATKNRHDQHEALLTQTIHKRSTALEHSVKILLLEGFNRFHGANLTLNSDVDQDTYLFGLHERPPTYQCIIS